MVPLIQVADSGGNTPCKGKTLPSTEYRIGASDGLDEEPRWDLIVLRARQNELTTIEKVPTRAATPFQAFRIKLEPDFELIIPESDGIPNCKRPFSFEFYS